MVLVYPSCSMRFYICWLSKLLYILVNSGCDYVCVPDVRGGAVMIYSLTAIGLSPGGSTVGWGTPLQAWRSRVDFPWYHWDVPLPSSFQQHYEPGVYPAPNRNEYQGYLLGSKGDCCGFGGLEVACWPLVPKFAGSNPAEAVGFFRAKKSSARNPSEGK